MKIVDARGLICPEPVMMLHSAVRDSESGSLIKVLATDPSADRDITKFCDFLNHELVEKLNSEGELSFLIRKGQG